MHKFDSDSTNCGLGFDQSSVSGKYEIALEKVPDYVSQTSFEEEKTDKS